MAEQNTSPYRHRNGINSIFLRQLIPEHLFTSRCRLFTPARSVLFGDAADIDLDSSSILSVDLCFRSEITANEIYSGDGDGGGDEGAGIDGEHKGRDSNTLSLVC